jgi:hypothetical protein
MQGNRDLPMPLWALDEYSTEDVAKEIVASYLTAAFKDLGTDTLN